MDRDREYLQLCQMLQREAREQIERMGRALAQLERGAEGQERSDLVDEAFRQAHNLKGGAASLGFARTARLAHAVESVLRLLKGSTEQGPALHALHRGLTALELALAADPDEDADPAVGDAIAELSAIAQVADPDSSEVVASRPRIALEAANDRARDPVVYEEETQARRGAPRTDQRLGELRQMLAREEDWLERASALRATLRDEAPPTLDRFTERLVEAHIDGLEHQTELVRRLRDVVHAFETDAAQPSPVRKSSP